MSFADSFLPALQPRLIAGLPQPLAQPLARSAGFLKALKPLGRPPFRPGFPLGGDEPVILGRIGSLEARLAVTKQDVMRAQALRYKVFYEEMGARPDAMTRLTRRDADRYDAIADHVLVVDHDRLVPSRFSGRMRPKVVGTYRLITQEKADRAGGFYTADEFEINRLVARHPDKRFLELGRSCVLPEWRAKRTIELLWTAIWAYARRTRADVLFGCASFPGADPEVHAGALAFLHAQSLAPEDWRVGPLARRRVEMAGPVTGDTRRLVAGLPPLIKAYLRAGAYVGDGAVADRAFGTTDVLIVLPVERIGERYLKHFG